MTEIKPIETLYNGYRFRSRLEARWAVFFDALGIRYEYEREGYETPHGYYLPDFWLPDIQTYVEIKPAEYDSSGEFKWPSDLRWGPVADRYRLIVLCGTPGPIDLDKHPYPYQGFSFGQYDAVDCTYYWCECPKCGCVDIHYDGRSARNRNHKPGCPVPGSGNDREHSFDTPRLRAAYAAARQARFEHQDRQR